MRPTASVDGEKFSIVCRLVIVVSIWLALLPVVASIGEAAQAGAPKALARRHVERGEALFRTGRFVEARVEFRAAAAADPRWVVPQYYLAYVDYKLGAFAAARRGFEKSLELEAEDGWSRYMLGLTLAKLGETQAARIEFERILRGEPDPELRNTARSTLGELLQPLAYHAVELPAWAVSASAGLAADTNPAYLADRVLSDSSGAAADALLRGAVEYRLPLARSIRLFVGGRVDEQAVIINREDADWTAASFWIGVSRPSRRVSIQAEYSYEYSLFGGSPYLGTHTFFAAQEIREASWTASRLEMAVVARTAQRDTFGYLESREVSIAPGQVISVADGALLIIPSYTVVRNWADDFSESFLDSEMTQNLYQTNYSYFGHGPVLSARSRLPFGFRLSLRLSLLWKEFDDSDVLSSMETMPPSVRSQERSDERLTLDATLWRTLYSGWSVFLSFSALDNSSTLGDGADDIVDRNYSRYMISAGIKYNLP